MTQGPGFLAGMLRGAVLSLAVLAALSVMLPGPALRQETPPQDRLEPPPGSEFSRAPVETPARLPEAERLPEPATTAAPPAGAAPAARESGAGADTEPVARPQVADVPAAPPAAPVAEPAPPPPAADAASPPAPVPGRVPGQPAGEAPRPARLPQIEAPSAAGGAAAPDTATAPEPAAPATSRLPQVAPPPAPAPVPGDAAQQDAPAPATAEELPAPQGDVAPAAGGVPPDPAAVVPAPSSRLPQIEPPAGPRLPGVAPEGSAPALPAGGSGALPAPGGSAEPAAEPATGDGAETLRLGALARNAVPFEVGERPLMAVVLIDVGPAGADIALLGSIPFPVSFAVDPSAPNAAERALALRAAGFEVLVLLPEGAAGLPEGATPADVEAALAAHEAALPMAAAMMPSDSGTPLTTPGPLARQMLAYLGRSGHGLVLAPSGLNSLAQAAARASVPALTFFRNLDTTREPAPAIRRYLDRAAFEARAQGRVAMLGHTYPETVRALLEWGSGAEARTVALAPVSALLRTAR